MTDEIRCQVIGTLLQKMYLNINEANQTQVRKLRKIKTVLNLYFILFNETCVDEGLLPKYIYILTYVCVLCI